MDNSHGYLLTALVLSAEDCSAQSMQRTGYETLQNIQQQRCPEELSAKCPQRERFETYQIERREPQRGDWNLPHDPTRAVTRSAPMRSAGQAWQQRLPLVGQERKKAGRHCGAAASLWRKDNLSRAS
jgi:hypothetical protein